MLNTNRLLLNKILNGFEKTISNFKPFEQYPIRLSVNQGEDEITRALSFSLKQNLPEIFECSLQTSEVGSHKCDLGIYLRSESGEPIKQIVFEAKILPTPLIGDRKEHEYVYAKSGGGISRFINEKHGVDDQKQLLPECGMVAYLKEENPGFWLVKINYWITSEEHYGRPNSELLTEAISGFNYARFISKHSRKGGSDLILHHFWVKI